MSDAGERALEAQLGAAAPPGVRALGDAPLEDLAGAVKEARRRQAAELAAAGDQALRLIPRVLRGPVRRVVS